MSKKSDSTIEKKCAMVKVYAERLMDKFNMYEDDLLFVMAQWAKARGFKDYWFAIDTELQKRHECANWFWIVRRIRNCPDYWL